MRWMIGFLCLVLIACGGGNDGGDSATTQTQPSEQTEVASSRGDDPTPAAADGTATQPPTPASTAVVTRAPAVPTETNNPTETPTARSTEETGGATTAPACPSAEYPAAGALSITDGAVEWFVCSPDEAYRTVIGASDDVVLIEETEPSDESGTVSRRTIAFDAADGSERWRRSTVGAPAGPFDGQGIVVLADQDARALVGVDVVTGEERWRVESSAAPVANSPTVAVVWNEDDYVGGPADTSRLRGIDRVTGDELWVSDILLFDQSGNVVARSLAAVLDEVLVVPTADRRDATAGAVTAIDMRTGAMLWQGPQLDDLVAADGFVVGTRGMGMTVTALDAASGQELWTAPGLPSYGGLLAVGDGVIVVLDAGGPGVIAYELPSGNELWRATRTPQPQMISGTSLVALWEGEISVLSTTDGATIWSATEPFGSPLMNSVGSNGDLVFVAINSRPWTD